MSSKSFPLRVSPTSRSDHRCKAKACMSDSYIRAALEGMPGEALMMLCVTYMRIAIIPVIFLTGSSRRGRVGR